MTVDVLIQIPSDASEETSMDKCFPGPLDPRDKRQVKDVLFAVEPPEPHPHNFEIPKVTQSDSGASTPK